MATQVVTQDQARAAFDRWAVAQDPDELWPEAKLAVEATEDHPAGVLAQALLHLASSGARMPDEVTDALGIPVGTTYQAAVTVALLLRVSTSLAEALVFASEVEVSPVG